MSCYNNICKPKEKQNIKQKKDKTLGGIYK